MPNKKNGRRGRKFIRKVKGVKIAEIFMPIVSDSEED